ncbi:ribonuclease H-like domain-containing protein [Tanacetum coccineum]
MKIPIIRKGEYDIWSMRMRQYICHTNHNLWDVIVNGDLEEEPAPTGETSAPLAPKTAKQLAVRRNQERVKSILLLAIPDEYLLKFHNVHGAPISKEDINQKFLRSLPPSWNQIALIMINKPDIDEINIDDLYNNLRVYEDEMKRSLSSNSASQNLAFLSSKNTSSTNEVSTASGDFRVSTAGGISQVSSTPCAHDMASGYVDCQSEKIHSEDKKEHGFQRKNDMFHLINQKLSATTVTEKGILLGNTDLEGIKGKNLMVTMAGAIHQQMNLHHRHCSSSSFNNEVQKCSKQCLESFKTLQKNFDSAREKHSRARLEIQSYELALESLESRILGHEKNELVWGEKYEFQNYELKCREIKINNLNIELEKVVKERDELKLKIEKWEESSKNLDELLNSQMSARDKTGLGYGTQLNEMSNNSETDSEISLSVFDVRSSDEESTPANDRSSKADGYHAVPPPITGNFLTPRADISFAGLDEYAIRKKIIESKTTDLNTKTSETVVVPKPKINRDKVIIEDWNSDDEDDVSAVKTVSPVKTNETQTVRNRVDKIGQISQKEGIGFKKIKACFDNAKRVNQQKISNNLKYPQARRTFVPSGVLTRTGLVNPVRPNGKRAVHTVSTARPISTARPVSTARPFAPKIAQTGSAIRPIYPRMDNVRPRASYSPIKRSYYTKPAFRPKNLKQDVKTSGVKNMTTAGTRAVVNTGKGKMDNALKKSRWVWRPKGNYMDHESKEKGSFILKKFEYGNPEICLQDHAVVDSGCSSHMTGNKAYLSDYEDYNGGFVAFGSDPKGGKITGKGKIKTANLDFDDVYFVDELKFNLFSVSQMCDKKNSVLFTDTECLILSPSFKLLDESQVVLRAPRRNDVYSLDLKNIVPSGGLENQLNHKVKIIRSDHGTEFKNHAMNEFCAKKGIKREFSVARTPQQNGVAERKNRTLIEAARTMLADSLLPIPFWAEAVNTACYVLNRVLVTKPQNKTPYELLIGKPPSISFMRPFGCPLTILNTLDPLGKFDGKSDEGYLLGYSTSSKAFRVYNKRTKRVEESLHIDFLEDQPNVAGNGPDWMFDLDFLTNTMNYIPVSVENQVTVDAGIQESYVAGSSGSNKETPQEYILLPLHPHGPRISAEDVAEKEEQHNLTEAEQALKDDLEKLVTQEMVAKAIDDATRQAFEEEKQQIASTKRAARATSINRCSSYLKIKNKIRQEEAGLAEAMRIQEEQELSEQQQKRKAERMVDMINQKKKYYAEQKAKAKRDKPMTQTQQRDYMSTFIKNQSSWKMAQWKKLTFEELKVKFEKMMRSIKSFVPMGSEERVKRVGI